MSDLDAVYVLLSIPLIILVIAAKYLEFTEEFYDVDLNSLKNLQRLRKSNVEYQVAVRRQSGNVQHWDSFRNLDDALSYGIASCRRARIEEVVVEENSMNAFTVRRAVRNDRSRQEGKRIEGFRIQALSK